MFCKKCGKEIDDQAVICIGCGCAVEEQPKKTKADESKTGMGILFGFLSVIGLIIGLCLYKPKTVERKTFLSAWGITTLCIICVAVGIFVLILVIYLVYGSVLMGLLGLLFIGLLS